jgi:hypothetical protein
MGAPDSPVRHRTVSGAPPRHPPVRAWSWSTVGGFVLMRHRTVRCHTRQSGATLTSALTSEFNCSPLHSRPLRADSRCSAGAPDSPVNYSGAAPEKPEGDEFEGDPPWCTGHSPVVHRTLSGAPDQGALQFLFAPFF